MSIYYCLVFEDFLLKVPTFQKVKNKRLVNALKICLLPHPVTSMQTPKRGTALQNALMNTHLVHVGYTQSTFASAKVQKIFDVNKF